MGRPSFKIDPQILRELREEKGKTQEAIAKELYSLLGKQNRSSDKTITVNYQRIEGKGATSRQVAEALAKIFNVSIENLQGLEPPEPFDYIKTITNLLREQLQKDDNCALRSEIKKYASDLENPDEAIENLAEDIGERIEAVQLGRNPSEIAELKALTGLSESKLLEPANVLGHWLVITNSRGNSQTEFVHGAEEVSRLITNRLQKYLDSSKSDSAIQMLRDKPWFRMEIKRAERFPDHMRIDFVRCHSEKGKGFRWADASWRDQFVIEDLEKWAKSVANFVINFDGKQSPNELRRLRLIVSGNGLDEVGDPRKLITGHLDQIDDELMIHCHQEGESHFLVLNWLISDLKTFIHPYLAKYPAECWMIQCWPDSSVNIVLNPGNKQSLLFSGVSFGHKYRIQLVEEITDGDFAPVPWRDKDMKELCEEIKGWLGISSK